ncbi:hypothetical protein [Streptomyces phaeochromogenes]|uniref:Secreted protein n=1 Tax=Streptomyces phaeochromogenes TaxID=1923 RepID=A0ABZ1HHK9_STRPH|nr:hypothetical protein [Streptomyces phaeochromogenes]WSD18088.1 hypothetical protein OHB35_35405 [Streptomyces phaeochromogenes]WSJ05093.1 hypothetical protein OG437_16155 [Streptomyces phaeochromogenes]
MKIVRIVLTAVMLAAGVFAAGPASSAPAAVSALPIQYKVSTITGPPNTVVRGTALCPTGTRMISSGAGDTRITSLTPLSDFSGASATGYTGSTPNRAFIRVLVGCLPQSQVPGVSSATWTSRTGIFFADANGFRRGVVTCPAGTRAFGGGGYFAKQGIPTAGGNSMHSNGVTADGTGWTARGWSFDRSETLVITTQCAPLPGALVAQAHVPLPINPIAEKTVHAPCPSGYTMLSGGFYLSKADGTEQTGTVSQSFPGAEGWIVSGISIGFSDLKLVALAQCFVPTG